MEIRTVWRPGSHSRIASNYFVQHTLPFIGDGCHAGLAANETVIVSSLLFEAMLLAGAYVYKVFSRHNTRKYFPIKGLNFCFVAFRAAFILMPSYSLVILLFSEFCTSRDMLFTFHLKLYFSFRYLVPLHFIWPI